MSTNARRIAGLTLLTLIGPGIACSGADSSDAARVSVTLDAVPENLACVRVRTQGTGEDWRLYDVARGAAKVSYDLSGLPAGASTVTVEGFDMACRAVGPFSAARWSAPSQTLAREAFDPQNLHFTLLEALWARSAGTRVAEGVYVSFSSVVAPGAGDAGSGATGDAAGVGSTGGDPGVSGGGVTGADAGSPDGGTNPDAGAPGGTPGSTSFCWGSVCVTLTDPSSSDGGMPDAGASGGGSGVACFGGICWVRRSDDGGVPPGATCLGPVCVVRTPSDDGGVAVDGGPSFQRKVCVGAVCAEMIPRRPIDPDGGVGLPGSDAGTGGPVCLGSICVFVPPGGNDDGGPDTQRAPITICGPQSCVMLRPMPNGDGGASGAPGGSGTLGTVCFEQACVTVSVGSGSPDGDAGTP